MVAFGFLISHESTKSRARPGCALYLRRKPCQAGMTFGGAWPEAALPLSPEHRAGVRVALPIPIVESPIKCVEHSNLSDRTLPSRFIRARTRLPCSDHLAAHSFRCERIILIGSDPHYEKASMGMEKYERIVRVPDEMAFREHVQGVRSGRWRRITRVGPSTKSPLNCRTSCSLGRNALGCRWRRSARRTRSSESRCTESTTPFR